MAQPKSFQQVFQELWDLLKSYAQQETVGPLKNLGNQFKWGILGSFCVTVGIFLLIMSILRALQTQVPLFRDGPVWSWGPYLITVVALVLAMVWVGLRGKKAYESVDPDRPSGSDPVGDFEL